MNFIKYVKFLAMLAVLMLPGVLASCGSDDEPEPTPDIEGVKVFDPYNVCYAGVMTTEMPDPSNQLANPIDFRTNDTRFNFVIDTKRNVCTVKIIDAKFAQSMPAMLIHLENLTYDPKLRTVTGNNIIPKMEEGGQMVPAPGFPFTSFSAKFGDEYNGSVKVSFEVNIPRFGLCSGEFTSTGVVL